MSDAIPVLTDRKSLLSEDSLLARVSAAAEERQLLIHSSAQATYCALTASFCPDVSFEEALRPEALAAARQIVNLCGFFPTEDPQRIAALTTSFEASLWPQIPMHRSRPTRREYRGSPNRDTSADRARPRGCRRATDRYRRVCHRSLRDRPAPRVLDVRETRPWYDRATGHIARRAARRVDGCANEAQASGCTRKPF